MFFLHFFIDMIYDSTYPVIRCLDFPYILLRNKNRYLNMLNFRFDCGIICFLALCASIIKIVVSGVLV